MRETEATNAKQSLVGNPAVIRVWQIFVSWEYAIKQSMREWILIELAASEINAAQAGFQTQYVQQGELLQTLPAFVQEGGYAT